MPKTKPPFEALPVLTPDQTAELFARHNEHIRQELLNYLAGIPALLNSQGPASAGQIAVQLGNLICWLRPIVERDGPETRQALDDHPASLCALGNQLRETGLKFWAPVHIAQRNAKIEALESQVSALTRHLAAPCDPRRKLIGGAR